MLTKSKSLVIVSPVVNYFKKERTESGAFSYLELRQSTPTKFAIGDTKNLGLSDTFRVLCGGQFKQESLIQIKTIAHSSHLMRHVDADQESVIRKETCQRLYSDDLSAMILMLKSEDFKTYSTNSCVNMGNL